MYKKYTALDYKKYFKLDEDYSVNGLMVYGTCKKHPYEQFENSLKKLGFEYEKKHIEHYFFDNLIPFLINEKIYWFAVVYGGAELSEYLHLASLFGSKKNILLGSCGGLKKGADKNELIIPSFSYAEESSAKAYQPNVNNRYSSDEMLSNIFAEKLSKKYVVHRGPTITYQAMMAETWDDIQNWSSQGYNGVEMEAATVFAASKYFNVPAAAILNITDNLIEEETAMDANYESGCDLRRQVSQDMFDVAVEEFLSN